MNGPYALGGRRIFPEKHLRAVAVIAVITFGVGKIPIIFLVIVLIHDRVAV